MNSREVEASTASALGRWIVRNVLGYTLFVGGLILSLPFVPGPGFAVVLLGMAIADWPGKCRFFRWLHRFRVVRIADDWIHQRLGFHFPEHPSSTPAPAQRPTMPDSVDSPLP